MATTAPSSRFMLLLQKAKSVATALPVERISASWSLDQPFAPSPSTPSAPAEIRRASTTWTSQPSTPAANSNRPVSPSTKFAPTSNPHTTPAQNRVSHNSALRQNSISSFLRRNNRIDLKLDDVTPIRDPFVDITDVRCLHQLKADLKLLIDPARHIIQPLGREPPPLPEPAVNRLRIAILKPLDNHVKQDGKLLLSLN